MAKKSNTSTAKSPLAGKGALGTRSAPWTLKTPSLQSEFVAEAVARQIRRALITQPAAGWPIGALPFGAPTLQAKGEARL